MNLFSRRKSRGQIAAERAMKLGAVVGITAALGFAARYFYHRLKEQESRNHVENVLDESLADTYPASDPTATQFFEIPANRM